MWIKHIIVTFILSLSFRIAIGQELPESRRTYDSLVNQLNHSKDNISRVNALVDLSDYYVFFLPDSALYYGFKALNLARAAKYAKGEQEAMFNIGYTHEGMGITTEAMQVYLEALRIADEKNVVDLKGDLLGRVGFLYRSANNFQNALLYTLKSIKILDSLNEDSVTILPLIHLADIYLNLKKIDSARYYANLAYEKVNKYGVEEYRTQALFFLGQIQERAGNLQLSNQYYMQALSAAYTDTIDRKSYNQFVEIAQLHQYLKRPDSAIFYGKRALNEARAAHLYSVIAKAASLLASVYAGKDASKAYLYSDIAASAKDSSSVTEKKYAIESLVGFHDQERELEIEAAKTAYENKIRTYILSGGLGVFLLIMFLLYRNNRQKQRSNKILESTLENLRSTQAQLIQSEKMASLGELTAGIGHEIKNPINFINNFSDLAIELLVELKSGPMNELPTHRMEEAIELINEAIQSLHKVVHHGKRADGIVKSMLEHARPSTGNRELTDINALADEYLRLTYQSQHEKDHSFRATVSTDFDQSIEKINIAREEIGRVFLNLYTNALYSIAEKSKISGDGYLPTVAVHTKRLIDKIQIRIRDNGLGISQKVIDKIFRPFFTTKPSGQGTGLGLSISYDLIRAHHGEIRVESKEGEYAEFIVEIPITGVQ